MLRLTIVLSAFCKAACLQVEEAASSEQLEQQLQQLQEQQQRLLQQQQLLLQQRPAHAPARKNGLAAQLQGLQHKRAHVSMPSAGVQGPQHRHAPASMLAVGAQVRQAQRHMAPPGAAEAHAAAPAVSQPRRQPHHAWKSPLQLSFVQESDVPADAAAAQEAMAAAEAQEAQDTPPPVPGDLAADDLATTPVPQPDQAAAEAPQADQALPPLQPEAAAEAMPPLQPEAAAEDPQLDQALPPPQSEALQPDQAFLPPLPPPQPEATAPQPEEASARVQQPPAQDATGLYQLRLCNAFAWPLPLEMRRVEAPMLVEYPLPYKTCRDYKLPLREGDQLEFSAGDASIGTFSVRGLPQDPRSQLLLISRRRDATSAAVAFDSHIFHPAVAPQVALIDAFQGDQQSTLRIKEPTREEELSFNSVVDVVPGSYKLTLEGATRRIGDVPQTTMLNTQGVDSYVVMRVGLGSEKYPEELVVFPQISGGARATICAAAVAFLGLLSAV